MSARIWPSPACASCASSARKPERHRARDAPEAIDARVDARENAIGDVAVQQVIAGEPMKAATKVFMGWS